ncbi:peroxiredoxin [Arcanobacterium wilhelmae]|uniref:Peroxiredoxin n=1 Tax=Arcanobacterium wilhelmae TaxID=1803177 RepID=A0ABT9NCW9_9ACTO|nr:TlpA disulfide reductase family protein [Arcanobacterium wilhelmae]MDP9801569.1 peroxiredoxin [Arcanobacterium wilhelmae]WFN90896.1 TlpA disulfide reductase family protein [Arcanobacterium wilhelmae]
MSEYNDSGAGRDTERTTGATPASQGNSELGKDWRARIRESKFGTVIVLAVTAAIVVAGAWTLKGAPVDSMAEGTGKVTAVDTGGASVSPQVGATVPDFMGTDINGQPVRFSQLKGKPVWLSFVASWCQGCRAEMPDVASAAKKYASQGLEVVSVFVGEDQAAVAAYAQRAGLDFTLMPDPTSEVSALYGTLGIPSHFFIDREGKLREHPVGVLSEAQIVKSLETIM